MIYSTNRTTDVNSKHVHFVLYSWIPTRNEPGSPVAVYEYIGRRLEQHTFARYLCKLYTWGSIPSRNKNYSEDCCNALLGKWVLMTEGS